MRTMPSLIVDLRGEELNKELVETAALYADDYENHLILIDAVASTRFLSLNPCLSTIKYCENVSLGTDVVALLFSLYMGDSDYIVVSFNNKEDSFNQFNFISLNTAEVNNIADLLRKVPSIRDSAVSQLNDENIKNQFKLYLNIIMAVKSAELELLTGISSLNEVQLNMRVNDNTGNILELKELKALKKKYELVNTDNSNRLPDYSTFKSSLISRFISDNFDRVGNLTEISSFPRVYKYLSSYIFLCAEESYFSSNLTVAYLLYFRAFETYCEGALIAKNKAKIANYRHEGKTYQLLFGGNYIKPLGFGKKWSVLKSTNLLDGCCQSDLDILSKHKKLRNILLYTHGDFVVNSILLHEFKSTIISIIKQFDTNLVQLSFPWEVITQDFKSLFIYDPLKYVSEILLNEHNLTVKRVGI